MTSFLSLPPEVRQEIYQYHFRLFPPSFKTERPIIIGLRRYNEKLGDRYWVDAVALFTVSRCVSREARKFFYSCHSLYVVHEEGIAFCILDNETLTNILVKSLYNFLPGIGKENRLFIKSLSIELAKSGSSWKDACDPEYHIDEKGRYLYRVFNLLVHGHSLKYLILIVTRESFINIINSKELMEQFSQLQNVDKMKIKYWDSYRDAKNEAPSDILNEPDLAEVAQKMISNAQTRVPVSHAQESACTTPPSTESAQALVGRLSSLLHHRTALVARRDIAARKVEEYRKKVESEKETVSKLERSIEGLDKDIAEAMPIMSS